MTVTSRSIADTPNRLSVEFQDALNGYQQDSYELVDPDDIALAGQEVSRRSRRWASRITTRRRGF